MHPSLKHLLLATALQEYDSDMTVGELISMLKEKIAATGKELAGEMALEYYVNSVSKEHNTDSDIKTGIGAMKKALVVEKQTSKKTKRIAKKKLIAEKKRLEMEKVKKSKKMLKLTIDTAIKVANHAVKEAEKSQKRAEKEIVKAQKKMDKEILKTIKKAEKCAARAVLKAEKGALKKIEKSKKLKERNKRKYKNG